MIYRRATLDDIPEIIEVVTRMVLGTKFRPPTAKKLSQIVQTYYTEGAWFEGQLIGFMCGRLSECFMNDEVNAYESGLFVAPEFRGSRVAVRLVRNFETWAKARGAQNVWMGQSVGHRIFKTMSFYHHLGYDCQGFNACKPL